MASPYERLGKVAIQDVIRAQGRFTAFGVSVGVGGLRIRTFREKGTRCSCCGLQATHFAVERHKGTTHGYHLNLWGVGKQGNEVLFTHDHTLARALGGANHIDNSTTMCSPCNLKKAKEESKLVRVARGEPVLTEQERSIRRSQKKAARLAEHTERMASDPEFAARVAFHQQRINSERTTQAVLPH